MAAEQIILYVLIALIIYYVGCNRGCAITGNPIISTAYGAFAGFLFVDWKSIFQKSSNKETEDNK